VIAEPAGHPTRKEFVMPQPENSTRIEIFDQSYQIRGEIEPGYVRQLAAYVDKKMREIADASKTVDSVKVAVMTALNIADELFQERENSRKLDSIVYDKSIECSRLLDQVLKR
jgi:cell division protein ZapA